MSVNQTPSAPAPGNDSHDSGGLAETVRAEMPTAAVGTGDPEPVAAPGILKASCVAPRRSWPASSCSC